MGFDIWVADDPELHDEDVQSDPSEYPSFGISFRGMRDLRQEMDAQGMTDSTEIPCTEEQIERALRCARREPILLIDGDGPELWAKWLAFLRSARGHGGLVVT